MGPLKLGPMPARAEGASAALAVSEVRASEKAIENRELKNCFMALNVTSPAGPWEAGNRQLRRCAGSIQGVVAAEVTRRILPSNRFRLVTSAATAFAPIPESTLAAAVRGRSSRRARLPGLAQSVMAATAASWKARRTGE